MLKCKKMLLIVVALLVPCTAMAHHGGVSLAFGPGSPVETASPLTLPDGGFVTGVRAEQAEWKQFDWNKPDNKTNLHVSEREHELWILTGRHGHVHCAVLYRNA